MKIEQICKKVVIAQPKDPMRDILNLLGKS